MNKKNVYIFGCLIAAVCIGAIGLFFWLDDAEVLPDTNVQRVSGTQLQKLKESWIQVIDNEGPEIAYKTFLNTAPETKDIDTHTQAHVFGEALYETQGIEGIRTCDSSFEFGCYHSFFGMAVYEEGIGALPRFDQACKDKYGSENLPCQHGIGHGLLVYTGYENLPAALEFCEDISWQPTGGCSSGVFMEYNFHTMESTQDADYIREIGDDPYIPCSSLPEKHQPSCYLEQVQWWENIYEHDYKKIGEMCYVLSDNQTNFDACFHGIGNYVAAFADLKPQHIIDLCTQMPDSETVALCHEGASWLVRGNGSGIEDATKLCEVLPNTDKEECLRKLTY